MIELERVSKRFGPSGARARAAAPALADVSLSVPPGETWAFAGPNGAGKTTLFGLILGFLRPTAGTVRVGGMDPAGYARSFGVGYLPEQFSVPAGWLVLATLVSLARLDGFGGDSKARAHTVLARLGLEEHASRRFGELSHGLRQRVGLAQALLAPRRLIVLDEPTEGLDPLWRVRLRELLAESRREGATVLVATHDLGEAERGSDRIAVLDKGRLVEVLDGSASASGSRYRIRLAARSAAIEAAFPGALEQATDRADDDTGPIDYLVDSQAPTDLSSRLAALLAGGAQIIAVEPITERLEERVRRALTGSPRDDE